MFDLTDAHIVIGLLKDWAQGLDISKPLPIETKPAAEICLHYLALLRAVDLYGDTREHEFIQLLFKVPHAAPAEVTDLIRSALSNRSSNRSHARAVLEHVTKSFECQPLCIHFPDLVIEAAEATWRSQKEYDPDYSLPDVDEAFGFIHSAYFDYFPPSALQGPFAFLLSSHSEVGIDFIVRMANEGAASYARSIFGNEVTNVTIHTSTGSRPIIASPRLWALYRGMMPGPQVLECALIALEAWLLGEAKQGMDIKNEFRRILDTSSSAATIAVLASVAAAYPLEVGEEVLSLLSVREFYEWDFQRSHQEQFNVIDLRPSLGFPTGGVQEVHYKERKDSAALPHRKSNLEELAFRLQFTKLRDRIWDILDQCHKALPPSQEQSEADKTWRIALHRMDSRHFTAEKGKEPGQVILSPEKPEADLQQFITDAEERRAPVTRRMRLMAWATTKFRRGEQTQDDFPDWRDALHEAQALQIEEASNPEEASLGRSGVGFVAAYLIRDRIDELTPPELGWCRRTVIEEVLDKDADRKPETVLAKNSLDGSRPTALVLPLLLKNVSAGRTRNTIEKCLAVAVTHTSDEVRDYAAAGVRNWLCDVDPRLANACVAGLLELAEAKTQIRAEWRRKRLSVEFPKKKMLAATRKIRSRIAQREALTALSSPTIDLDTHDWPELLDALNIIRPNATDPDLYAFAMACLSAALHEAEQDEAWQSHKRGHYEFQHGFATWFAGFALARPVAEAAKIGEILRNCVERCPKYLGELLDNLAYEEDKVRSGEIFWSIWKSVSEPIFAHDLLRKPSSHVWRLTPDVNSGHEISFMPQPVWRGTASHMPREIDSQAVSDAAAGCRRLQCIR